MVSTSDSLGLTAPTIKLLLTGGLGLALLGLVMDLQRAQRWISSPQTATPPACDTIVSPDAELSRAQLAQLLTVPERDSKDTIREIVAEPYCRLAPLPVRAGVTAEREAYPLAFKPGIQLVILYENDEYAGYRFRFP